MHSARLPLVAGLATLCLVLAGCSSKVADTTQYSGFLPDYSKLKPSESPSGHQTLRWISPDDKLSDYRGIYYTPVVYYPAAKPNNRVSQATLDQIRTYLDTQLKAAVAQRKPLVSQPEPGTLVMKTAITAVNAENQDMKIYEVVPVAAVVASTMAVTKSSTKERTRNLITVGFIAFCAVAYLVIGQAPQQLLIFAGAFNGLILPVGFALLLWVAWRRRDLMQGYAYPKWLLIIGVLAWLLTLFLGWNSLAGLAKMWA